MTTSITSHLYILYIHKLLNLTLFLEPIRLIHIVRKFFQGCARQTITIVEIPRNPNKNSRNLLQDKF